MSAVLQRKFDGKGPGELGEKVLASSQWSVPKKYGPHGELFFFLLKKEPLVLSESVEFGPSISAVTVKARAVLGLHMMAECGCPMSPVWSSDGNEGVRILHSRSIASTVSIFSPLKSLGRIGQIKESLFSCRNGRSGGWH